MSCVLGPGTPGLQRSPVWLDRPKEAAMLTGRARSLSLSLLGISFWGRYAPALSMDDSLATSTPRAGRGRGEEHMSCPAIVRFPSATTVPPETFAHSRPWTCLQSPKHAALHDRYAAHTNVWPCVGGAFGLTPLRACKSYRVWWGKAPSGGR